MNRIHLPFPDNPSVDDARPIVESIVPLVLAARQEEYLSGAQANGYHLHEIRRPDVARVPETDEFKDCITETRFQLAIAFYAMHATGGCNCDSSFRQQFPQRYLLEQYLNKSRFSEFMMAEVQRRRRGPELSYPTLEERRMNDLIEALRSISDDTITVNVHSMPPEEVRISPANRVLAEALDYYHWALQCIGTL